MITLVYKQTTQLPENETDLNIYASQR